MPLVTTPYGARAGTESGKTPDGALLASWGRRLGAYLIDGVIVGAVWLSLSWRWLSGYVEDLFDRVKDAVGSGTISPSPFFGTYESWGDLVVIVLIGIATFILYHATFLRLADGASLGKKALGIRVRLRERDGQLPWSAISKRLLVQLTPDFAALVPLLGSLVVICAWLDGLWPLWDAKSQALHDKWPGTNVVHR